MCKLGNWRIVQVKGNIKDRVDRHFIREYLYTLSMHGRQFKSEAYLKENVFFLQMYENVGQGLGMWIHENGKINGCGTLYERGGTVEGLRDEISILAKKFDSMELVMHVGEDFQSHKCEASIIVKDGKATISAPMIQTLRNTDYNTNKLIKLFRKFF